MYIKRILTVLFALAIILSSTVPLSALGQVVSENTDYIVETDALIGWSAYPFTVNADGSFALPSDGADAPLAVFGANVPSAKVSFREEPYPVSTHTFKKDGLEYTVEQFLIGISADICIYSRLEVKNTTDVSVAFPTVTLTLPITEVPGEISPQKSASCDYMLKLDTNSVPETAKAETDLQSYNSAKKAMIAYWDTCLEESLTVSGLSDRHDPAVMGYKKELIRAEITSEHSVAALALSSAENAKKVLAESLDLYGCATALQKTGDRATALARLPEWRTVAEAVYYKNDTFPQNTLSDNLDSLLALQSYGYILRTLAAEDDTLSEEAGTVTENAKKLSDALANALKDIERSRGHDWETVTESSKLSLSAEEFRSATALCEWYIKSGIFTDGSSSSLIALAKDAIDYYNGFVSPEAAILSLITEREDGTLLIGRGTPYSVLRNKKTVNLEGLPLSSGATANLSVSVKKTDIEISVSGAAASPIQAEFPVFASNIEYASVGFDSDSGIVTAPVGTSAVSVRLTDTPASLEKDRASSAELSLAITDADTKAQEITDPTSVSKKEFESALSRAKKAIPSTVDEKLAAADALCKATESLSPMVSGYTHLIPESESFVGMLKRPEIYQKFSLPSDGTVENLFVKGEYSEDISAAIYTLRGDNYTTDELLCETYGEPAEGGITFDIEFEAAADTVYVLCVFSENGEISLALESSDSNTAHTVEMGEPVVYSGASLALCFSVRQADRRSLDTFYDACMDADLSDYTKESQKVLKGCLKKAKVALCTPSVTEDECDRIYNDLKDAYNGLDTYASEDKIEDTPVVGLVLIGLVIILLVATLASAMVARKKMDPNK